MTTLDRGEDKLKFEDLQQHYDQDDISGYCSLSSDKAESPVTSNNRSSTAVAVSAVVTGGSTPPSVDEKRMRREIANSNERRRMQSINAGFQSLRSLLPHHEGEKLSKAAILQQTAEYIYQLEQERTQLLSQNCQLKRVINQHEGESALNTSPPSPAVSSKKRKTVDSSDEDLSGNDELIELKIQLDRERALRIHLEEKVQRLESVYPISTVAANNKLQESLTTEQITLQYHKEEPKEETTVLLNCGNAFENRRDIGGTSHPCVETKRNGSTSVILQPITHEESLLSSAIINGHQYSVSPALANSTSCSSSNSIKLKSKVEVERLPSPTSVSMITSIAATTTRSTTTTTTTNSSSLICNNAPATEQILPSPSTSAKVFLTSTSRQNLETIVEAIRHLEGDSLFDSASGTSSTCSANQEAPLALTKRNSAILQVDMNPFLKFHSRQNTHAGATATNTTTEQQQRPGVIVVKQQT